MTSLLLLCDRIWCVSVFIILFINDDLSGVVCLSLNIALLTLANRFYCYRPASLPFAQRLLIFGFFLLLIFLFWIYVRILALICKATVKQPTLNILFFCESVKRERDKPYIRPTLSFVLFIYLLYKKIFASL